MVYHSYRSNRSAMPNLRHLLLYLPYTTLVTAIPTWPNPKIDTMEETMFQQAGMFRNGFVDAVITCGFSTTSDPERNGAAEWIRTAFHDMATANIDAGTGGLDGSIQFELDRAENAGAGLPDALGWFSIFLNPRSSLADLITLGVYAASVQCGGPEIKVRVGRKDAAEAGPFGVPQPHEDINTHTRMFEQAGFNTSEMIGLVACGHTVGAVHRSEFPEIVPPMNNSHRLKFDETSSEFDMNVVSEYLDSTTKNPLVVGPELTNSDKRIFEADGNTTMRDLGSSSDRFMAECGRLFQKMVDTVPKGVELSEPLEPYPVKPIRMTLELSEDGKQLQFSGAIRVLDNPDRGTRDLRVVMRYKDRNGKEGKNNIIEASPRYLTGGGLKGVLFTYHEFNAALSVKSSISSFVVDVIVGGSKTETFDNNGKGFPVEDKVLFQQFRSCQSSNINLDGSLNMTFVAAVHKSVNTASQPVSTLFYVPTPRNGTKVPTFVPTPIEMKPLDPRTRGEYSLFKGLYKLKPENQSGGQLRFDVLAGNEKDEFREYHVVESKDVCF